MRRAIAILLRKFATTSIKAAEIVSIKICDMNGLNKNLEFFVFIHHRRASRKRDSEYFFGIEKKGVDGSGNY